MQPLAFYTAGLFCFTFCTFVSFFAAFSTPAFLLTLDSNVSECVAVIALLDMVVRGVFFGLNRFMFDVEASKFNAFVGRFSVFGEDDEGSVSRRLVLSSVTIVS